MRKIPTSHPPELDPGFAPAALWNQSYREAVERNARAREVVVQIGRPDGKAWNLTTRLLPDEAPFQVLNRRYGERLVKTLLWIWGGSRVSIQGAPELAAELKTSYAPGGARAFDAVFMGPTCFLEPFLVEAVDRVPEAAPQDIAVLNRDLSGCRIGFDLGGSDRKCAALIDGEVVFSEEVRWSPYFESDPNYHLEGIRDSLRRAAKHLPRVDAIGGSAAGLYIDNEPRVASLFRGIGQKDFEDTVRNIFHRIREEWGGVPLVVANDGDVAALAGAISLQNNGVLGLSMGTSEAAGYVDPDGNITGWFNELAFAPVDYRVDAPADEWSGDLGCGVQYFSQQAVGRLVPASGLNMSEDVPLPEILETIQDKMKAGDERAAAIYRSIGSYFGYSIAHYADFYDFRHLLFLGRVSSGEGGRILLETAEKVLAHEFPKLAEKITISTPDEAMKRHGQAVAAASLPVV